MQNVKTWLAPPSSLQNNKTSNKVPQQLPSGGLFRKFQQSVDDQLVVWVVLFSTGNAGLPQRGNERVPCKQIGFYICWLLYRHAAAAASDVILLFLLISRLRYLFGPKSAKLTRLFVGLAILLHLGTSHLIPPSSSIWSDIASDQTSEYVRHDWLSWVSVLRTTTIEVWVTGDFYLGTTTEQHISSSTYPDSSSQPTYWQHDQSNCHVLPPQTS